MVSLQSCEEADALMTMIFRIDGKNFSGPSALDVVRAIETATENYPYRGQSIRHFLTWSLARLGNHIPPRELGSNDRMEDEEAALNYLCLRDEYGAGKLVFSRPTTAK